MTEVMLKTSGVDALFSVVCVFLYCYAKCNRTVGLLLQNGNLRHVPMLMEMFKNVPPVPAVLILRYKTLHGLLVNIDSFKIIIDSLIQNRSLILSSMVSLSSLTHSRSFLPNDAYCQGL